MSLFGIGAWIVLGLAGGYIFAHKGLSPKWGIIYGILLGPIGLVLALCFPATAEARARQAEEHIAQHDMHLAAQTKICPQCRRENSGLTKICPRCNFRF
jgi:hypothetical protein